MTTFYAKSKMAYPEYRYNILDSNRRHTIYETDGRLRLGGNSVVFTKADTEEKVITVSRVQTPNTTTPQTLPREAAPP